MISSAGICSPSLHVLQEGRHGASYLHGRTAVKTEISIHQQLLANTSNMAGLWRFACFNLGKSVHARPKNQSFQDKLKKHLNKLKKEESFSGSEFQLPAP